MRNTIYSSVSHKVLTALVTAAMVLAALPVSPAFAGSISVNTTDDEFTTTTPWCSLREAIVLANNNGLGANDCTRSGTGDDDIITLESGSTYTLSLTSGANSGDLDIGSLTSGSLTIQASGSTPAIIDANDIDRVLDVDAAGNWNLTLINIIVTNGNTTGQATVTGAGISFAGTGTLTLTNTSVISNISTGATGCGAGIYNNSAATIVITNSTIDGNTCDTAGADGGGLFKGTQSTGSLTITNSTFSNNSVAGDGGGARFDAGTVSITNSTFANNTAGSRGGGIQVGGAAVTVEFSTFSDNAANGGATNGGAVQASSGSATISTSILANSTTNSLPGNDCDDSASGPVTVTNSIVESNTDCSLTSTSSSDPGLSALADNGGPTLTMAIGGAPAADAAASCNGFTTDQRGSTRPQNGLCDLGAYEIRNTVAPAVVSIVRADSDPTNAPSVNFTVTFSETVFNVDASDFSLTETVSGSPSVTNVSGSGAVYTVTVSTGTGNGTIRLDVVDNDSIVDIDTNTLDGGFTNGEVYTIDKGSPTVSSIIRADANPTNAASVDFGVAFSESVSGVDVNDFDLTTTGVISGASITDVNGVGETYTVTVNTGSGDGTIRLDVADNDSIVDGANNSLGGLGAGNGDFTSGEVYDVDKTITLNSISPQDGWILESSETSGVGGTMNNIATTFNLGDNATDKQYRDILSFNTSSLPDNAVITKVTLKVRKHSVVGGGDPVSLFQGFKVDIKTGIFGTGALELGDFQATASKSYGPFSPALSSGWYSLNLTIGKGFINKVGHTQLRLRFTLDDNNNNLANFLRLYSGNAGVAVRPQLIIEYSMP